jgi:hypothetical protein
VETLAIHAAAGVETPAHLRSRLGESARGILRADAAGRERGWWRVAIERIASLVTVRRTGEVPGGSAEARLARAETRLAAGDLFAAVAEMAALEGDAAAAAAGWLAGARARLAVESALADLESAAVARIAAVGTPPPGAPVGAAPTGAVRP